MKQDKFDESYEDEPHRLTNIEMIQEIMTFSKYGGMVQIFIMMAVETYCDQVLTGTPEEINEHLRGFTSPDRWSGVAAEVKQKLQDYRSQ